MAAPCPGPQPPPPLPFPCIPMPTKHHTSIQPPFATDRLALAAHFPAHPLACTSILLLLSEGLQRGGGWEWLLAGEGRGVYGEGGSC